MNTTVSLTQLQPNLAALIEQIVKFVTSAIDSITGPFSIEQVADIVRPQVYSENWSPKFLDALVNRVIERWIDYNSFDRCFDTPEKAIAMLDKTMAVMKEQGFETAGQAIEFMKNKAAH